ncbi:MAG: PPOX class F420-dependent oxidoreductase [Nitrososphaerales archaeon]
MTTKELNYLSSKKIGRLATISKTGQPHVVPVMYSLQGNERIVVSGTGFDKSYKFKNVQSNPKIAFVVDSVKLSPWTPMGIELRGEAKIIDVGNGLIGIEIIPFKKASWGIDEDGVE